MKCTNLVRLSLCLLFMGGMGSWVMAQSFPDRPVKIVIAAPPAGGMDAVGRALGLYLSTALKQPVVIENRPGGNGVIATQQVAKSPADGYTLLLSGSFHTINPWTIKKLPYDSIKDFVGVAKLGASPLIFVAGAGTGVKTGKDFAEFSAKRPLDLAFAVSVMETRLGAEAILNPLGKNATFVSYKGTGPAMADLIAGHVPFFVTTLASILPFKDTGKMNIVGVTDKKRSSFLPDVPTLAEQGIAAEADVWYGLLAPAGTPKEIVERLNKEIVLINAQPEYLSRMRSMSIQPANLSHTEFDQLIRSEMARFEILIKASKIQPE